MTFLLRVEFLIHKNCHVFVSVFAMLNQYITEALIRNNAKKCLFVYFVIFLWEGHIFFTRKGNGIHFVWKHFIFCNVLPYFCNVCCDEMIYRNLSVSSEWISSLVM
jgi:hypothetical protein